MKKQSQGNYPKNTLSDVKSVCDTDSGPKLILVKFLCLFVEIDENRRKNGLFAPFCWPNGVRRAEKASIPRVLLAI